MENLFNHTFAIHTLGCKVNTYESDVISENMRKAGFLEVSFEEKADIYIINTCTVTNIADRKSRQMLHRARKRNPEALIIAAGCYVDAVQQGKGLPEPEVDLWVGNQEKSRLTELCIARLQGETECSCSDGSYFLTELDGHTRAFVKIEDGCGMFCTYCIIPYVRGKVVSRPVEDTLKEVRGLAAKGIKEVVLTGIHLSSMGKQLIETIRQINGVPGIERIRLGSLEPRLITENIVNELGQFDKLCHHFHLSLQSGSDTILKAMNRRYTAAEFLESCRILKRKWPDVAITTDIIVGFPGETEQNFEETLAFARQAQFYEAHIFKYSRRKGTKADQMPGQITEAVKSERSDRLSAVCEEMSRRFRERFLGRTVEFLAEELIEAEGEICITGYTREYVRCVLPLKDRPWAPGQLFTGTAQKIVADRSGGEMLSCIS